jgi:hypothetical protein
MRELDTAEAGDALTADDLQRTFDWFTELARSLEPHVSNAPDVAAAQAVGRTQEALRERARALVEKQIALIAGQARITAEHIDSAVAFADKVIKQIADIESRLEKIGKVLDFFAVVLTGQGDKIVEAAVQLKSDLSKPITRRRGPAADALVDRPAETAAPCGLT